jgi:hypothetical protein
MEDVEEMVEVMVEVEAEVPLLRTETPADGAAMAVPASSSSSHKGNTMSVHKTAILRDDKVHAIILLDPQNIPESFKQQKLVFIPSTNDVRVGYEYRQGSFFPPAPNYAAIGAQKIKEVNAERKSRLNDITATVGGNTFDGDEESVRNLSSILVAASSGVPIPWPIEWRGADNVIRTLTHVEAVTLAAMLMQEVQRVYSASWRIKDVLIPQEVERKQIQRFNVSDDTHWA